MEELMHLIDIYNLEIILGMGLLLVLMIIIQIVSHIRISSIRDNYDKLVRGQERPNLEEVLLEMGRDIDRLNNNLNVLDKKLEELKYEESFALKKTGVIRYDALEDLGSRQSYSVALLDDHETGFILTSIYGRDYSYNYVKPIKEGVAEYKLSVEEIQALDKAKNS